MFFPTFIYIFFLCAALVCWWTVDYLTDLFSVALQSVLFKKKFVSEKTFPVHVGM